MDDTDKPDEGNDKLKEEEVRCLVCNDRFDGDPINHGPVCEGCLGRKVGEPKIKIEEDTLFPPDSSGVLTLKEYIETPGGSRNKFFSSSWEDCVNSEPRVLRAFDGRGDLVGIFSITLFGSFIPGYEMLHAPSGQPLGTTFNLDEVDGITVE